MIFYVAARYRLPYQVALTAAAGGGASWMIDRLRERAWKPLGLAVAATLALAAFVAWPTGLDDGRAEEQVRMGLSEIQAGRIPEGEAWIQRAAARHGYPGVVHVRVGQLYESRDQPAAALEHYKQAAALDPTETSVQFVMGRALFAAGKDQEALAPLETARTGRERDAATRLLVLAFTRLAGLRTPIASCAISIRTGGRRTSRANLPARSVSSDGSISASRPGAGRQKRAVARTTTSGWGWRGR